MSADKDNPHRQPIRLNYTPATGPNGRLLKTDTIRVLIALGALAIFTTFLPDMVSSFRLHGDPAPPPWISCMSNLREIGQGLCMYAYENDNAMPAALSSVVTMPRQNSFLTCPSAGRPVYIYLPTPTMIGHGEFIYVYEPLGMHEVEGAAALFGDGHVEWCTPKELRYYLDLRAEKLARAATQPTVR